MADQPRHPLLLIGLSVSQVISWGTMYYALPATSTAIARDTGWSVVLITTAFSAGLILSAAAGIPVGRLLDRAGPRLAMTVGTVVGVVGLVAVAVAPSFPLFIAAWCVVGLGQSATLYQAAFTVINTTFGTRRGTALTVVTLAAGLASTIFAPIAVALTHGLGWRGSFLILAGILLTVAPIHATLLPRRWPHIYGVPEAGARADPFRVRRIARSRPFLLLQVGVTGLALALYALTINLVPLLTSAGLAAAAAATAFGLVGVGQVAGRAFFAFGRGTTTVPAVTAVAAVAVIALAGFAAEAGALPAAIGLAVLAGAARGSLTLIQASVVVDRWGTANTGHLTGVFAAPVTIATAIAPAVGAALLHATGGATTALLCAAVAAIGGSALLLGTTTHRDPRGATRHPTHQ
ncbi:MFS transporter [Curtobacterium flaccumfaciens pv. oortii]|uniref:MFS transporter n=1 Tax=Curtobacterium flaccumfaciens TaxID=2035 RepID=UPI001BDEDDC2|nr:MFS transporter [Curtobacterium flaccumfaciens]MBT1621190.1 MFS transporter [Curtobacterium flaccumfaciens pv. oortii]